MGDWHTWSVGIKGPIKEFDSCKENLSASEVRGEEYLLFEGTYKPGELSNRKIRSSLTRLYLDTGADRFDLDESGVDTISYKRRKNV